MIERTRPMSHLLDPEGFSQALNDLWIDFLNLFVGFYKPFRELMS